LPSVGNLPLGKLSSTSLRLQFWDVDLAINHRSFSKEPPK